MFETIITLKNNIVRSHQNEEKGGRNDIIHRSKRSRLGQEN